MTYEVKNIIKQYFCLPDDMQIDKIKIDHYSWSDNSLYRYFDKQLINMRLIRQVEIAVENEFLRWDDDYSKQIMIEGLGLIRCDRNIPSNDAWEDTNAFENAAIKSLQSLIQENDDLDILGAVRKSEYQLQEAKKREEVRLAQIYERILYELNECSLREFNELKRATLIGEK